MPSCTLNRSAWSTNSSSSAASLTCVMIASRETKLATSAANEMFGVSSATPVHTLATPPRNAARRDVPSCGAVTAFAETPSPRRPTAGGPLVRPEVLGVCTTRAAKIERATATGIARGSAGWASEEDNKSAVDTSGPVSKAEEVVFRNSHRRVGRT